MKKYVFVKQLDSYDCGPACVSMLLQYTFKIKFSISELKQILNVNSNGATFLDIKTGLNNIGIKCDVLECEKNINFFEEVKYPFLTQISFDSNTHFIVIYGKRKNNLIVGDPSKNKISLLKINDFFKLWEPYILKISKDIDNNKLNQYKDNFKKFNVFKELLNVKWLIITSWIISIINYIVSIYLIGMYSVYFDTIIPNKLIGFIASMFFVYITVVLLQLLIKYIDTKINIKINNKIDKSLIENLINNFFSKEFLILESYQSGEIITRFSNINKIRTRLVYIIQTIPLNLIIALTTLIIMLKSNFNLSLLIFIPIILFILFIVFSHDKIENLSYELFEDSEKLNIKLIESITNIETIKNYLCTKVTESNIKNLLDNLLNTSEKLFSFENIQTNLKNSLISIFNIAIFSFGSYLIINDNIASGVLLMFNSFAMNVFNPFLNITNLYSTLEQGKVAQLRYEDIVNTRIKNNYDKKSIKSIDSIELKNISFSYGINKEVLKDINLKLEKNTNVAIIGKSGSGKSTLAKLIAKYYEPTNGEIYVNKEDFNIFKIKDKILYSPQDIQIFSDTILNNIIMNRNNNIDDVNKIANKIGFNNVINEFNEGYNTRIGANGVKLSMGQAQLLNIIRSTLTDRELIIFDEVTNGIDLILKKNIKKYLLEYGNIKIFITHDLDLAMSCDKIHVIKKGILSEDIKKYVNCEKDILKFL